MVVLQKCAEGLPRLDGLSSIAVTMKTTLASFLGLEGWGKVDGLSGKGKNWEEATGFVSVRQLLLSLTVTTVKPTVEGSVTRGSFW